MPDHRSAHQLQLRDYLEIFARRWKALVLVLLCTLAAAFIATTTGQDSYKGTSEVLLRTPATAQLFPSAPDTANRLVRQGAAELTFLSTGEYLDAAYESAGVNSSSVDVSIELLATDAVRDTGVIRFEVEMLSASGAADVANAFASTYIRLRNESDVADIDRQLADEITTLAKLNVELESLRAPLDLVEREISLTEDPTRLAILSARQNQLLIQLGADVARLESELAQVDGRVEELGAASDVIRDPAMTAINSVVALPASRPSSAGLSTNLPIALAVGLVLGVGAALLLESLDTRIHDDDRLRDALGLPVLARISEVSRIGRARSTAARQVGEGPHFESFRGLRASLMLRAPNSGLGIVQITSPTQGNGKTTITRNLAHAFAKQGESVLVIDADMRRPTLAERFSIDGSDGGLSEILQEELDLASTVVFDSVTGVFVLPAGQKPANPSELLGNEAMSRLLKETRGDFDVVIVDSPPLLPVPDARLIASVANAVVLVSNPQKNSKRELSDAKDLLDESGATVLGIVLNRVRQKSRVYEGGYQ